MWSLLEPLERISRFLDEGGPVLWVILFVCLLLWTLIVERYLYLYLGHRAYLERCVARWQARADRSSWYAMQIRRSMIADIVLRLNASLPLIRTLIAICPLLGLLGTVIGMIHIFDVMAFFGTGNARAMASGVSLATIPTMAGMVVAISGLFFSVNLQQHANSESQRAADLFLKSGEVR